MSTPRESKKTTREKAAAARAAQQATEKRRERTVRIVGAVAVLAVIGIIFGLVWFQSRSSDSSSNGPSDTAALPTGALGPDSDYPYGVPYGNPKQGAPVLQMWEDFQCPACAQVEQAAGANLEKLAEQGSIQLVWRTSTFLDRNLNNDASLRAAAAWGCAIDAGKAKEYHNTVFANQPAQEGDGFTDEQLLQFGKQAGISGAAYDTFATCFNNRTYLGWAQNSTNQFYELNIPGTPNAILDGKELPNSVLVDPAALQQAIDEATS